MAEILGIVANVAALIQLAHYGEKFAKALLNFSKQNSSPRKEVDRCASQAQDFSDCINMTHFTLERHFANFTKSPLLQYLSSQGILDRILNRSKSIEWQLDKATIRVRSLLGGGNAVFNFLKWWYQKDSILDLFPEMNSVKISLQLLVSATQLEVLDMECKDSLWDTEKLISNEKHINHLKKVIRVHQLSLRDYVTIRKKYGENWECPEAQVRLIRVVRVIYQDQGDLQIFNVGQFHAISIFSSFTWSKLPNGGTSL
ncbi:hypothetical protein CABS01_11262 [Colletotrichum abscissum]|uniref:uncharacterized protein n=1 Tax=Colletotrichum abscissum TaxID=1671311 RepID=UPI0027D6D0CC|nr:uncharacterized protein CABS01_11262 [Colletotrichum abscissum]KAK1495034.1 hypothetical protein CABS01_11262 [Colletotrichum abscissum]